MKTVTLKQHEKLKWLEDCRKDLSSKCPNKKKKRLITQLKSAALCYLCLAHLGFFTSAKHLTEQFLQNNLNRCHS